LELFATRVGNEMNNPLCAILSAHEYLRRRIEADEELTKDPRIAQFFDVIESELAVASRVASDLVDFGARRQVIRTSFVLRDCVTEVFASIRKPSNVTLVNRAADVVVNLDRDKLIGALLRVVQNGVESIPDERPGAVVVDGTLDSGKAVVRVVDDGVGFSPELADRIREPLFTTKVKGTGLGLAIAESLVRAQGGELRLTSPGEGGAVAAITIPSP
jgi:signal transduction histidine kinase